MAQEQPKDAAKDQTAPTEVGTKCAFSGVRLRRVKRYYRNGQYYINKRAYQEHAKQLKEKEIEEKEKADAKASASASQQQNAEAAQTPAAPQAEASQPASALQNEVKDQGKKE